jgi:hypothetical protein
MTLLILRKRNPKKEGKMEGKFFEKGWVETLAINGPLNL